MKEARRIRNGLNEWNRPPEGYVELPHTEPVQAGDVQKISDEWYLEYPANGLLVGHLRGCGGKWYRKPAQSICAKALTSKSKLKMSHEQLKAMGYEVAPSKSQPGRFRWWLNTGGDGVSVPPRECSEVTFETEGAAWEAAQTDAEILGATLAAS